MIVGSRVRIKSLIAIHAMCIWRSNGIPYVPGTMYAFHDFMEQYCNIESHVTQIANTIHSHVYMIDGCGDHHWHPEWFYDLTHKNLLDEDLFIL